jgi:hypothetical protein
MDLFPIRTPKHNPYNCVALRGRGHGHPNRGSRSQAGNKPAQARTPGKTSGAAPARDGAGEARPQGNRPAVKQSSAHRSGGRGKS